MGTVTSFTLSNNLEVRIDVKSSPIVAISLMGKCGSLFENTPGLAHFTEHMSLDGSSDYPDKNSLYNLVTKSGGNGGGRTNRSFVEYYARTTPDDLLSGLIFVSQVAFYSRLSEEDFTKEKNIISNEINQVQSNTQKLLFEKLLSETYKNKAFQYNVVGNSESISKLTIDDIKEYRNNYFNPNNFVLSIVGNVDLTQAKQIIENVFSGIPNRTTAPKHIDLEINNVSSTEKIISVDTKQTRFMVSYASEVTTHKEHLAEILLSYILGRGNNSLLFKNVREKHQLVYDISSWVYEGLNHNMIYAHGGSEDANIQKVIDLTLSEFESIPNLEISEQEFLTFKRQLINNLVLESEDAQKAATNLSYLYHCWSDVKDVEDQVNILNSILLEDVKNVAKKLIKINPHTVILANK